MPKPISKAKKEIARKNAENTERQRLEAAPAKALKQEKMRQIEEQKWKAKMEADYLEYQKLEKLNNYKRIVRLNASRIVREYFTKLRNKIWSKKIDQIRKLAKSSSNQEIIMVSFMLSKYSQLVYYLFEVVENDEIMLCTSAYKNFILPVILSKSEKFKPSEYNSIFKTAGCQVVNVEDILDIFSNSHENKVIECISKENDIYRELFQNLTSQGFIKGVSSVMYQVLENAFKKGAKLHNLDITKFSENKGWGNFGALKYEISARNTYNRERNYEDEDYDEDYNEETEETKRRIRLTTGIRYTNGCNQCKGGNPYNLQFDIGFEIKSNMYSILYNNFHYTFVNIDDLFNQLLKESYIYDKPICQNCCKYNEVQSKISDVMSKLPGLMYDGYPEYEICHPMDLNNQEDYDGFDDDYEGLKPCINIKLPEVSAPSSWRLRKMQIIMREKYERVGQSFLTEIEYTARVPMFRRFMFWNPEKEVTIAFRNMQIAFLICQSILGGGRTLPDFICMYIYSFIIIPDMESGVIRHRDFNLGKLDNSKILEDFVNKVNFRAF